LSFPLSLGASSRAFVAHGDVFWVRSFRPWWVTSKGVTTPIYLMCACGRCYLTLHLL
jgi:hypothetical protein